MSIKLSSITEKMFSAIMLLLFASSCEKDDKDQQPPCTVTIPDTLKAGTDEVLIASYYGVGTQNYEVKVDTASSGAFKWVFIEPVANLYDNKGNLVVLHFKGPTWQYIADSSSITGAVIVNIPSPVPSQNIPWLLLNNKANAGTGFFARVNRVQRLDTRGGVAPTAPPTVEMLGATVKVPYSALYNFYRKK
jgi:Protein of unknown function (DUF3455)